MVKRMAIFCCALVLCFLMAGCDPYAEQRPGELGEATWTCKEKDLVFRFNVDSSQSNLFFLDGEFVRGDEAFFCKFYFIFQTNRLFIDVQTDKHTTDGVLAELDGNCDFSPDSFVMHINKIEGDFFEELGDKLPDELTFIRTDLETSDTDSEISGTDMETFG